MRKALLVSCFLLLYTAGFGQQGFGIRLGDPSGFSYKRYSGNNALEISVGRTHVWTNAKYYSHRFDKWYADATSGYTNYIYTGSNHSLPIGIQVHYLVHTDWFDHEFPGLQWYYGYGGQFRMQSITHTFQYQVENDPSWYPGETEKLTDMDIGLDGVLGAEYEFQEAPFRIFIDLTVFVEIVDDPFIFSWPAAIGGRYMF